MTAHSFLTALSPIEYRHDDPDGRLAGVREAILTHEQDNSPFQHCPMAHMVRLQLIDQLTPPMGDVSGKQIKTKYLLFVADIDGGVDDFLDCLYRTNADFVEAVWGRCLGYPDYKGAVFFRRYISRCMFTDPLGYAGFPASVGEMPKALANTQALADWIGQHQGLSAAELQKAWRQDRDRFIHPDVPAPGKF